MVSILFSIQVTIAFFPQSISIFQIWIHIGEVSNINIEGEVLGITYIVGSRFLSKFHGAFLIEQAQIPLTPQSRTWYWTIQTLRSQAPFIVYLLCITRSILLRFIILPKITLVVRSKSGKLWSWSRKSLILSTTSRSSNLSPSPSIFTNETTHTNWERNHKTRAREL